MTENLVKFTTWEWVKGQIKVLRPAEDEPESSNLLIAIIWVGAQKNPPPLAYALKAFSVFRDESHKQGWTQLTCEMWKIVQKLEES